MKALDEDQETSHREMLATIRMGDLLGVAAKYL